MNKKQKLLIFSMATGIFLCMLDTTIMNIALPSIQTGLNVDLEQLSWALNIYTIVFAVFTIPFGRLADILGRNKVYLFGLVAFGGGSLISGLASNAMLLIAGRAVQSLGAAVVFPASMTIGISMVGMKQRKIALSVLGITQGLAAAFGPTLGGIVTQYLGWRYIFFCNLPLVLLAGILSFCLLPLRKERTLAAKIDFLGMLLSMSLLFSLTLALVKGNDWGWQSGRVLLLGAIFISSFILFVIVEHFSKSPMIPLALFRERQFTGAALAVILTGVFLVAIMVIMPTFFTKILGKSELAAAFMITPTSLMIFFLSPIGGQFLEKIGPRLMIATGFCLMVCGYLVLSLIDPRQYTQIVISLLLIGGGFGIIAGPVIFLGAAEFTGEMLSASQSVLGLFRQVGTLLAVAIFVSALTTNLKSAKTAALTAANARIAATSLPQKSKKTFKARVQEEFAKEGTSKTTATEQTSKNTISKTTEQQLVAAAYQKTIQKIPNGSALPQGKQTQIRAAVALKVKQELNRQQRIINTTTTKIQADTQNKLQNAFIKPFRQSLPWIVLASFSSLLFDRKKKAKQA